MRFLDTLFELFLYLSLDDTLGKKIAKKPWHHTLLQVVTVVVVCILFAALGAGVGVLASGVNLALGLGLAIGGGAAILIYLGLCIYLTYSKNKGTTKKEENTQVAAEDTADVTANNSVAGNADVVTDNVVGNVADDDAETKTAE
jgi:hypothetical protein